MKNYFVIVHEKTGILLLNSARLPIYWRKNIAKDIAKNHPDYVVRTISIKELKKLLENGSK
jgi:hypothetical protein